MRMSTFNRGPEAERCVRYRFSLTVALNVPFLVTGGIVMVSLSYSLREWT